MTWNKLDDEFTDKQVWRRVTDFQTRWYYLVLTEWCARHDLFDGRIPHRIAVRSSDVDDPESCLKQLLDVGLLRIEEDAVVVVSVADDDAHVLPPSYRNPQRREGQNRRKRESRERQRLHKQGDHSKCLPEKCPYAGTVSRVTDAVTPGSGSGSGNSTTATTGRDVESVTSDPKPWLAAWDKNPPTPARETR